MGVRWRQSSTWALLVPAKRNPRPSGQVAEMGRLELNTLLRTVPALSYCGTSGTAHRETSDEHISLVISGL